MKRVLVLCTGNSCRSQMAEALWQKLSQGAWQAASAGSKPAGYVHPLAVRAMRELDIDISANESKSLSQFQNQPFDLVVTVCDRARKPARLFPAPGRFCIGRLTTRRTPKARRREAAGLPPGAG